MSVTWTQQQDLMHQLYRFAYALCGDSAFAIHALEEALDHLRCNPEATEHDRAVRKLVLSIRKYCFRKKPPAKRMPASQPLPEDWEAAVDTIPSECILKGLEEMPASILTASALFYATTIPTDDIARILGVDLRVLAEMIQSARRFLAGRAAATTPKKLATVDVA